MTLTCLCVESESLFYDLEILQEKTINAHYENSLYLF